MNIDQFKKKKAGDLRIVAKAIESAFGSSMGQKNVNTTPILTAATQLESSQSFLENIEANENYWGYEIEDFKMPVETLRHIRPVGIKNVELILNMKLVADARNWGTLNDPLVSLSYNVTLRAISDKVNYFCFHVDKHDMSKFSIEPHPIYHIQYSPQPKYIEQFDYGNVLHIDTPRLMHQPLDFILGLGFLVSNFIPSKWDGLIADRFFKKTYKEYQECILKPYNHSLANHWNPFNSGDIVWNNTNHICPYIL